ncbi:MAG: AAA family ATPase, partial [Thermoplasmata archaeon]
MFLLRGTDSHPGEPVRLTVKERILLHLLPYGKYREAREVPRAVAQDGISAGCSTSQRHLSQYLRPLIEDGLLHERKAHIQGGRQRRKVYFLTREGRRRARGLRDQVMVTTLQVEDEEGTRELTVGEILAEAGSPATPLGILRLAGQGRPIQLEDAKRLTEVPRVELLAEAPSIEAFVGRKEELETLTAADSSGPRLYVIRGVAGIGKSSLASRACELLRGSRNFLWHRVRPRDSREAILARLGAFLADLGRPGLRAVLMRGQAGRAEEVLREDLPGTEATLVFDDAHEADRSVEAFFGQLLNILSTTEDVRVLILSRTTLSFYSRRDVVVSGLVKEFELEGLNTEEVEDYVALHEIPEGAVEVAQKLHGHPLFLELLRAHNPYAGALVDVRRYLEEEVYTDLPHAERDMMKIASLYQVPVPRDALFADPEWSHDVLLSLAHRSLVRRVGEVEERFELHDTIREFFGDLLTPAERASWGRFAVERLRTFASEAREARAYTRSAGYLNNAVELAEAPGEQAALWEALGDANLLLGDLNAVTRSYRAAARLAEDAEASARAYRKMAMALQDYGDAADADAEIKAGLAALGDRPSVERGWLHLVRSQGLVDKTKIAEARKDIDMALSAFREFKDTYGEAKALLQLVNVMSYSGTRRKGDPAARAVLDEVLDLAERLDDPELAVRAHTWMTRVITAEGGSLDEVRGHFEAAEAFLDEGGSYRVRLQFLSQRAALHGSMDGDYEARADDCREIIRIARAVRSDFDVAYGTYLLAMVDLLDGRIEEAKRRHEEAAEAWKKYGNRLMYGNTLFHIGRICLMQADAQGFRRALDQLETVELEYGGGFPIYPVELRA